MSGIALTATYRLQMNAGFTFAHARARVDYFARLGVSHLYLSPILAARRGSMHGYDVVDPTRINPELGTERDLRALSRALHARDMGLILDIVPNHMGIGAENPYWDDVLAHGERSRYAVGSTSTGQSRDGAVAARSFFPCSPMSLDRVLARGELSVELREGDDAAHRVSLDTAFPSIPRRCRPNCSSRRSIRRRPASWPKLYSGVERTRPSSRAPRDQHYRLVDWRRGARRDQLPPLLRRERSRRAARRRSGRVRRDARVHAAPRAATASSTGCASTTSTGCSIRRRISIACAPPVARDVRSSSRRFSSLENSSRQPGRCKARRAMSFSNDLDDVFHRSGRRRRDRDVLSTACAASGRRRSADIARAGKHAVLNGSLRADVDRLARLLHGDRARDRKRWTSARS